MILVDSSLWILQARGGLQVSEFVPRELIAICPPVLQEVLQGAVRDRARNAVEVSLLALPMLESPIPTEAFLEAAELYRTGRRIGYTIRSAYDCLIAACAIRNRVPVYHCDRDFDAIARFSPLRARNVMQ